MLSKLASSFKTAGAYKNYLEIQDYSQNLASLDSSFRAAFIYELHSVFNGACNIWLIEMLAPLPAYFWIQSKKPNPLACPNAQFKCQDRKGFITWGEKKEEKKEDFSSTQRLVYKWWPTDTNAVLDTVCCHLIIFHIKITYEHDNITNRQSDHNFWLCNLWLQWFLF